MSFFVLKDVITDQSFLGFGNWACRYFRDTKLGVGKRSDRWVRRVKFLKSKVIDTRQFQNWPDAAKSASSNVIETAHPTKLQFLVFLHTDTEKLMTRIPSFLQIVSSKITGAETSLNKLLQGEIFNNFPILLFEIFETKYFRLLGGDRKEFWTHTSVHQRRNR